jgi:hypothetical protein
MKVTINKVMRYTEDKNGNPLRTKDGKPYTSLRMQVAEYPDKWMSGFDGKSTATWKEGDVVEVFVEQKGEYLNFKVPNATSVATEKIGDLEARVVALEKVVFAQDLSIDTRDINDVFPD